MKIVLHVSYTTEICTTCQLHYFLHSEDDTCIYVYMCQLNDLLHSVEMLIFWNGNNMNKIIKIRIHVYLQCAKTLYINETQFNDNDDNNNNDDQIMGNISHVIC